MSQERTQAYATKATSAGADRQVRESGPRPTLINKVFSAEKLLLARMMESLGNPPLDLVLWDGQEIASLDKTCACAGADSRPRRIAETDRQPRAWLRRNVHRGSHRGAGKSGGLPRSDLSSVPAYRAGPDRPKAAGALQCPAAQQPAQGAAQYPPSLRHRQRFLQALARPGHGVHLRLFSRPGDGPGRRAGGEARLCVPQAAPRAWRNGARDRLRLGRPGAAHGQALRRNGESLQHIQRADCLRAGTRSRRRPGGSGAIHRGRLPQR